MFPKPCESINAKGEFLEQTKAAREERALEKHRENSVILIQAHIKGWLTRIKFTRNILKNFDEFVPDLPENYTKSDLKPALDVYRHGRKLLLIWKRERDCERFLKYCRYVVRTLDNDSLKFSFVAVALNKDVIEWIAHMNRLLSLCCDYIKYSKPELTDEMGHIVLYLHVLISFTSTNCWTILKNKNLVSLQSGMNQLCANLMGQLVNKGFYVILKDLLLKGFSRIKIPFKSATLSAILTLSLRPLISAEFSEKFMTTFIINILSVPGLICHIFNLSLETISTLEHHQILRNSLDILSNQQSMRIIFNALEGSYALCLVANLIQLAYIERKTTLIESCFPAFTVVITGLLESCQNYVLNKQSTLSHWHPILGWFAQPVTDPCLHTSIPIVKMQLHYLWNVDILQILLGDFLSKLVEGVQPPSPIKIPSSTTSGLSISSNIFKKFLDTHTCSSSKSNSNTLKTQYRALGSPEVHRIVLPCALYQTSLHTLTQLNLDILSGLCYQNNILYDLWLFLNSLGPQCGLKAFLDHLAFNSKCSAPEFKMLQMFADCMTHYITLLDDIEMYEKQKLFTLNDFIILSNFLNVFLYKAITGFKCFHLNSLFPSLHNLLMVLYKRDSWRTYTLPGHWLIKELKSPIFFLNLEKERSTAQILLETMPHILPHEDRVRLFRKYIVNEKAALGLSESATASPQSTLITVHRSRLLEDGYRQLSTLSSSALKGVIRVRFINEYGLDEAGIDQDGVFKEFLEESIKKIFDPELNLFKVTSEHRLYPSPTSYVHDNHLQLLECTGKILGKAIYEGIVVDVPFASFFLSQVAGQTSNVRFYSSVDELPSLDLDLYRNLTYVKHHQEDVADLNLTFSVDECHMGQILTYELVPGGKALAVTKENLINYIYLMAHFRMHVQIKEQTMAFIKGFRSIVNPEWLSLFSTPELQRLISGDNIPLDLKDLRRYCQYYGGFHDSHRVIGWLWDILQNDFNAEEKGKFLKFVTSCSKPPLLGFAHLEPPFSIRCVEVGDDEDTGDTIGSVFRGFFTIRKKDPQNRLPTSSTCFNLLKLPNYQKKSTLREKLRYAINCNTGFELS